MRRHPKEEGGENLAVKEREGMPARVRCLAVLVAACAVRQACAFMHVSCFLPRAVTGARSASQRLRCREPLGMAPQTPQEDGQTWQALAETLVDPFASPLDKPALLLRLMQRAPDIAQTVGDVATQAREPEAVLGPRARQQLRGARAVSRQLTQDIIPDTLPQLQELAGELAQNPQQQLLRSGSAAGSSLVKLLDDLTAEGKLPPLPSPEDVAGEARQLFDSGAEALETPAYTIQAESSSDEDFEIRRYAPLTTATVSMAAAGGGRGAGGDGGDGQGFRRLASFLFGENSRREAMAMTTPVVTRVDEQGRSSAMFFILPSRVNASTAPQPLEGDGITLATRELPLVAAREFAGFATRQEVVRQRSMLLSALGAAGWQCEDAAAVEVLVMQYDAPLTLPTLRRNEILIKLDGAWSTGNETCATAAIGTPYSEEARTLQPEQGQPADQAQEKQGKL